MYEVGIMAKPFTLKGTEAINWCRARGLAERREIREEGRHLLQCVEVHPTFARIWFQPGQSRLIVRVDLDEFGREEIVDEKRNYFIDMGYKLRFKAEQVQWLVIRDYIDRTALPAPKQDNESPRPKD